MLDVDRPSLQKWTDRFEPSGGQRSQVAAGTESECQPAFVELLASGTAATSCLVEVESQRGAKMRLELKGIPTSQLAELIRAFAAS